jgi:hypothetical protein
MAVSIKLQPNVFFALKKYANKNVLKDFYISYYHPASTFFEAYNDKYIMYNYSIRTLSLEIDSQHEIDYVKDLIKTVNIGYKNKILSEKVLEILYQDCMNVYKRMNGHPPVEYNEIVHFFIVKNAINLFLNMQREKDLDIPFEDGNKIITLADILRRK